MRTSPQCGSPLLTPWPNLHCSKGQNPPMPCWCERGLALPHDGHNWHPAHFGDVFDFVFECKRPTSNPPWQFTKNRRCNLAECVFFVQNVSEWLTLVFFSLHMHSLHSGMWWQKSRLTLIWTLKVADTDVSSTKDLGQESMAELFECLQLLQNDSNDRGSGATNYKCRCAKAWRNGRWWQVTRH